MDMIKFIYHENSYRYDYASNLKIEILGRLLLSDVKQNNVIFYKNWLLKDKNMSACGNITALYKEDAYVYLSDLYSEEKIPTKLKMAVRQFIQLLDDWQEKVCKDKPKEVIIKHEDGEFVIETKE